MNKLKKLINDSETKWKYYISALQISFIFMVISIFGLGRVSDYFMGLSIYLSATTGVLTGIALCNMESGKTQIKILVANFLNSLLMFYSVSEYISVELYSKEFFVLFVMCVGACFMLLWFMSLLSALVYILVFK